MPKNRIGFLSIPLSLDANDGVAKAPEYLRNKDIMHRISQLDISAIDYGDVLYEKVTTKSFMDSRFEVFVNNTINIKKRVMKMLNEIDFGIVFGGDASITLGATAAHCNLAGNVSKIFIGCKPLLHTIKSKNPLNMNDVANSMLLNEMQQEIPWSSDFDEIPAPLHARNIGIVGCQKIDNFERYMIDKYNIKTKTTAQIDRNGIYSAAREVIQSINPENQNAMQVHVCLSALSSVIGKVSPDATGSGLTFREILKTISLVKSTGKLKLIEISGFNPEYGEAADNKVIIKLFLNIILEGFVNKLEWKDHFNYYSWVKWNKKRGLQLKYCTCDELVDVDDGADDATDADFTDDDDDDDDANDDNADECNKSDENRNEKNEFQDTICK